MGNFHQLEVVGRGSETQLQVGENLYFTTWHFTGRPILKTPGNIIAVSPVLSLCLISPMSET